MIKVCYIPLGADYGVMRRVADILKKDGIEFVFIARTKVKFGEYKKNGSEAYFISEIFNQKRTFSDEELFELELKYGPHSLKAICNSDIYLRFLFKNQWKRVQFVARAYKFWEDFFDTHNIDYVLVRHTALFDTRTMYNVARFRGKPLVATINIGPGSEYFSVCDVGEENCWSELLNELAEGPKILAESQRKPVLEFLKSRKHEGLSDSKIQNISPSLFALSRNLYWECKEGIKAKLREDPVQAATFRFMAGRSSRGILWKYITQRFFHYDMPRNERYVYFPLFYEKEIMRLATLHYWTQNQTSLVRELAESLPTGFHLYVKEHPAIVGSFSLRRLKEMRRIPRVKIVHPSVSAQELIDNSQAVVVLDGTTGWQAYLRRKPVIIMTNSTYFSRSRLIYKVSDPCDLPQALLKALREGSAIYDKNYEEWLWFIHAVITTCGAGKFESRRRPYFTGDVDNYKKIASYISQKIRRNLAARVST